MKKILILICLIGFVTTAKSQFIFPESYKDCKVTMFLLENDTTITRISDEKLIETITNGFSSKVKAKIKGNLSLQIFVDTTKSSCLLSVDNKTNIKTKDLNLQKSINNKLIWSEVNQPVSTIVIFNFDKTISIKRLGYNENFGGWREISDKKNDAELPIKRKQNNNVTNFPETVEDAKTKSIWKLYNTGNSVIPYNMSRSVKVDSKGVIWCCTDEGIVKIDNDNWTVLTADNTPLFKNKYGKTITSSLNIDKQDRIWIESFGNVIVFDDSNWFRLDTINPSLKNVSDISIDRNGIIWFGTAHGLVKYDNENWFTYNTDNSPIPSNTVREVFLDNENNLWIATEQGIAILKNDSKWTIFDISNSKLPSNSISCIKGDEKGNIWIGTNERGGIGGLIKIDKENKWNVYTTKNSKLPANTIWDITIDKDAVWLANLGNLVRFDGNDWEIYNSKNSIIPNNYVSQIAIDKNGNKWIATFVGLVFTTR